MEIIEEINDKSIFCHKDKLDFDFLVNRGYVPTCRVGGNTIYNKWGFELDIHFNFVFCKANTEWFTCLDGYISTKADLIDIEKRLNIDRTPIITNMSISELKALIPIGYTYILNKRKKYKKPDHRLSFRNASGRYKILRGDEVIIEGYNDELEDYFLCRSLLYILKQEDLLPKNL